MLTRLPSSTVVNLGFAAKSGVTCSGNNIDPALTSVTLSSGTVTFYSQKILSSGTFIFTASGTGLTSGTLEVGPITNAIKSINTSLDPINTYYTYYDYTITVTLIGSDDNNFILSTTLTITSTNGYLATITESNTSGTFSFSNKYFTNGGADTITIATNPYVNSKPVSLTITKSKIILEFDPVDSIVRNI